MSHAEANTLNIEHREEIGTNASRRLRKNHLTPAILFGHKKPSIPVMLSSKTLNRLRKDKKLAGHILQLTLEGKTYQALVQSVQTHPLRDEVTHVELLRVQEKTALSTELPIEYLGENEAPAALAGGQIIHFLSSIKISCLPKDLPDHITIDVSELELDQTLHLNEVSLPKGVKLCESNSENISVCVYHLPKKDDNLSETTESDADNTSSQSSEHTDNEPPAEE